MPALILSVPRTAPVPAGSEKVRYQYTKTNAEGFEFYESTGLGGDGDTEYYPFYTGSRVLRPGQKVYYRIENNNAEEKTIKLKIAPVLTKEINVAAGTGAVRGTDKIKAGTMMRQALMA